MNDRYLWDRTGEIDPETARLERLLAPLAHGGRPLDLAGVAPAVSVSAWRRAGLPLALAATVVFMVGGLWRGLSVAPDGWTIVAPQGQVTSAGRRAIDGARVGIGGWVHTDAAGRVRLRAAGLGTVDVGPGSRLRIVRASSGRHVLALATGTLDAEISAAPGAFVVETRSALAVDLGCRYRLAVNDRGEGWLQVTLGWVGLESRGRESLVPAGAMCATRVAAGPGTPYFEGATPRFVAALSTLDGGVAAERGRALTALLDEARPLDAITLWHLLTRLDRQSAERVYSRLAAMVPPSVSIRRDAVLAGDRAALGLWWEQIGLGDLAELRRGMVRAR